MAGANGKHLCMFPPLRSSPDRPNCFQFTHTHPCRDCVKVILWTVNTHTVILTEHKTHTCSSNLLHWLAYNILTIQDMLGINTKRLLVRVCVCACACVCVLVCACACVRVCVHASSLLLCLFLESQLPLTLPQLTQLGKLLLLLSPQREPNLNIHTHASTHTSTHTHTVRTPAERERSQ